MARGRGEVRALTYRRVTCSQRTAPSNTWVLHLQKNQSVKQTNRQINKCQKQELLRRTRGSLGILSADAATADDFCTSGI